MPAEFRRLPILEPTSMMSPSARHNPSVTRDPYPPEMFDRMTDILADLVLEDMRNFPQISVDPRIDRCVGRETTIFLTQDDGK